MGKVGNGVNGSEEEQGIGTSDENGEQNVERRFCCFGCKDNFIVTRFIKFRCVFVLLLSVAVFLSALFWLPPFIKFADQGGLDLDYRFKDHDIVASFLVNKSASLLEDNILKLQDDIFDEMNVPNTKVVILSLEPFTGSNTTKVMFGVDPLENNSKITSTDQSLIRSLFEYLVVNDSSLRLTESLFGDALSFEVLKFPGGITIIPPQSAFLLQNVRIPFNFTLNFSIFQIRENFADLKSQLMTGLHLTTRENLYINLWNSQGSTVAPPTTVLSSVILVIGNTPRLKQLAQTIRGHSKNLGLNNTVFGKVKQRSAPAPVDGSPAPLKSSPAPHNSNGAKPPGCQFGCKRRFTGNGRKGSHLAPSNAPSSSPHFSATSPQPDNGPPSVSPTLSPISQTIPASSPLPNVVFAHAQPPSGGKPEEHHDTMPSVSPLPAPSSYSLLGSGGGSTDLATTKRHPHRNQELSPRSDLFLKEMANLGLFTGTKIVKSVNVSFRLPYYTHWGQRLLVCGSEPVLGSWDVKKGLLLSPAHQGEELIWCGSVAVPSEFSCEYSYYVVDDEKSVLRREMGKKRKLVLPEGINGGENLELHDLWQTGGDAIPFRSAFKDVIFRQSWDLNIERPLGIQNRLDMEDAVLVHFKICCPNVEEETSVYVIGSTAKLGQWKVHDGLKLNYAGDSVWQADAVMQKGNFFLETGAHRDLSIDSSKVQPRYIFLSDGMMREMPWRGAGVAIPMFSVRSEADLGVGEFLDLKLLVDWAVESGFHLVQLLPINDTSVHGMWWDSYPYSSLSVFALHPLYLRVEALSENLPENIKKEIQEAREQLDGKDVDYEATLATKLSIAKKVFEQEKDLILNSRSFHKYFSENEEWLKPYAAFCFLRDFFETSDHSQWGRFSCFTEKKLEKLVSKDSLHHDIIRFHYYIQFHLHLQLSEAAEYARNKGVILKGDLPIGVDRNSVDTWVYPNLFRMNTSTGAPPDYFDKNGQNWGFPTYNWEEMSKDNYAWWRARLTQMAKYFTAYRIDHILGFFRIWELPEHAMTGLIGKFRPSIPLSKEELEREGIWDFDRLSLPYIRQEFVQEKFGASWTFIVSNFLNDYQKGRYEFKEDSNTEKKIASKLKMLAEKSMLLESEDKIRRDLFDLLKNIVLIRDPEDASKFYPRFNLEDTSSFQDLDDHSKNVLRRLYYDYYFHRQENLWRQNALKTLPALLNSSDMLACGEDLGLIPACVHPVMQELGLIGLRIQRMPSESDLEFGIPSQYSYMTVCAPSCHDCSTFRAWWEEDEERRCRYFKNLVGPDAIPSSQCVPDIAHFVIRQHVEAPSMWAIFPLQDLLALKEEYTTRPATEETINDPTNPKHYWRYRVHVTLESLLKDKELIATIKGLVRGSGRSHPSVQETDELGNQETIVLIPGKHQVTTGQEKISVGKQLNGVPRKETCVPQV
ncbi:hypothetical protein NC652_015401 [Populus alba x Populus x berolinensis]|nr:hypothetical protein NC652_015401 [Populus alba x Populus x berolinensis]